MCISSNFCFLFSKAVNAWRLVEDVAPISNSLSSIIPLPIYSKVNKQESSSDSRGSQISDRGKSTQQSPNRGESPTNSEDKSSSRDLEEARKSINASSLSENRKGDNSVAPPKAIREGRASLESIGRQESCRLDSLTVSDRSVGEPEYPALSKEDDLLQGTPGEEQQYDVLSDEESNDETSYIAPSLSPDIKSPVSEVSSSSGKQALPTTFIDRILSTNLRTFGPIGMTSPVMWQHYLMRVVILIGRKVLRLIRHVRSLFTNRKKVDTWYWKS